MVPFPRGNQLSRLTIGTEDKLPSELQTEAGWTPHAEAGYKDESAVDEEVQDRGLDGCGRGKQTPQTVELISLLSNKSSDSKEVLRHSRAADEVSTE